MAIPSSGKIGLISCPDGIACTSISMAVYGNTTPDKSLFAAGCTASITSPIAMSDFYGYQTGCVTHELQYDFKNSTDHREVWTLNVSPSLSTGSWTYAGNVWLCAHCYLTEPSCASINMCCNGNYVYNKIVSGSLSDGTPYTCDATFSIDLNAGDTLSMTIRACVDTGPTGYSTEVCLYNVCENTLPNGYTYDCSNMPLRVTSSV